MDTERPDGPDTTFSSYLQSNSLIPINASGTKNLTHFPHNSTCRPSMLDDILMSSTLFPATHSTLTDISCPSIDFFQYGSDHHPVTIHCPQALIPILHCSATPPVPHMPYTPTSLHHSPPPITVVKHPIPAACLEKTRVAICDAQSISCESMALRTAHPNPKLYSHGPMWLQAIHPLGRLLLSDCTTSAYRHNRRPVFTPHNTT